ncbi:kinesin-like protein KIF9 isoform X2 [Pezoporus occidentalis]|uniref:kinesin-like protein KIF9 isoform X2 n=1 Tax=Pezoporus occidentalis TaxID=407982 RepID=UPI002F90938B
MYLVRKRVHAFVRVKPTADFAQDMIKFGPDNKSIEICLKKDAKKEAMNSRQTSWSFRMDGVLHNTSQEQLYETVAKKLVSEALIGYNGTIMCYGQTGAGKTYTMMGATADYKHRGIIPRAIQQGENKRVIAEHALNKHSSRSHCIFTIYIESRFRFFSDIKCVNSKINLIDLAGSERQSKSGSEGQLLKEATYINKSLSFLEQVITALADPKRDHIPFRQSKLTYVLKDSLGRNCNTVLVANVCGEAAHVEHTLSSLRFANRMKWVTTEPVLNETYDQEGTVKALEKEIAFLKQELAVHDSLANRSLMTYDPLSHVQIEEIKSQVHRYLKGAIDEIDIVNLRQIREVFRQFKLILRQV